jgi:uncharacterized protein
VDSARPPQDPAQLLSDLTQRVPGVRHALVVSADGVPVVASPRLPAADLERLAAITSGLISLASSAAVIFDGGPITQAIVVMEQGTMIIMSVDGGASLAVLTAATADLDPIAYEMTMLVQRSAASLSSPPRAARTDP